MEVDKNVINFNKTMGKLIAEEFSEFVSPQNNNNDQNVDEIFIRK